MKYIQCPDSLEASYSTRDNRLFLAGGISNCGDWQTEMKNLLASQENIIVINPRRLDFDRSKISDGEQIGWERRHLHYSNLISFWFPDETVCPITLFEFGYWLNFIEFNCPPANKKIFVGASDKYSRRSDLVEQIKLSNGSNQIGEIVNSIEGLTNQVISHINRER
jgi:hypothetical protein